MLSVLRLSRYACCQTRRVPPATALAAPRRSRARVPPRTPAHRHGSGRRPAPAPPAASLRGFVSVDAAVPLDTVSRDMLTWALTSPGFASLVAQAAGRAPGDVRVRFTGHLFQPVPWSPTTKHGMPSELEAYRDAARYAIVQVPANIILECMVKGVPRLCAIFELRAGAAGAEGHAGGGGFSSAESSWVEDGGGGGERHLGDAKFTWVAPAAAAAGAGAGAAGGSSGGAGGADAAAGVAGSGAVEGAGGGGCGTGCGCSG